MGDLMQFWPVVVYVSGLFFMGVGLAVGLTMWILGKLNEQDSKRRGIKEDILKEMREQDVSLRGNMSERHHSLMGRMEQSYMTISEKIDDVKDGLKRLSDRVLIIETIMNGKEDEDPRRRR